MRINTIKPKEKQMFATRMVTALGLIIIGAFVIFIPIGNGLPFFLTSLIVVLMVSYEISTLMIKRGYRFYIWVNTVAITFSFVSFYLYGAGIYDTGYLFVIQTAILSLFLLVVMFSESVSGDFNSSMENIGISLFGYVILGIFSPLIGLTKMMDESGWILAILFSITWMSDAGGLFFGKFLGKHKISNLSSPNKTVEGYIGSVLFGALTGLILFIIQRVFALKTRFSPGEMIIVTLAIIIASIIGDLGESTLKRWSHSKDSGDLLPGHGGFFDRFDSVIFAGPVYFVIMKFMGY